MNTKIRWLAATGCCGLYISTPASAGIEFMETRLNNAVTLEVTINLASHFCRKLNESPKGVEKAFNYYKQIFGVDIRTVTTNDDSDDGNIINATRDGRLVAFTNAITTSGAWNSGQSAIIV